MDLFKDRGRTVFKMDPWDDLSRRGGVGWIVSSSVMIRGERSGGGRVVI